MQNIAADATRDASQLLDRAWAGPFGVDVPVDPVSIARSLGVDVFTANLDMGVAGLLVKRAGQDPAIYLNANDSENRQRFTCAHELGHYIRRSGNDDEGWEYVDRRDQLSSAGTDPEERYANGFAAQLLMPEHEVRSQAKKFDAAALAYTFGVSLEAMNNRLATLRIARD
ncbi:ImmA/IrrE family metallo-endopeptidase [Nocardioides sp. MH1]|uniref:ImmA/IrrE family metallo-endopeptidase n=1 Tax=Nocardioides sp. MH1 TaxID=3242490 RepID=UPI003520D24E